MPNDHPTWRAFLQRLRELTRLAQTRREREQRCWRHVRSHLWMQGEWQRILSQIASDPAETTFVREEFLFRLTLRLSVTPVSQLARMRLRDFRRVARQELLEAEQFIAHIPLPLRQADTDARVAYQMAIDVLPLPFAAVLTFRFKGLSWAETGLRFRLTTLETYDLWREGMLRLREFFSAP